MESIWEFQKVIYKIIAGMPPWQPYNHLYRLNPQVGKLKLNLTIDCAAGVPSILPVDWFGWGKTKNKPFEEEARVLHSPHCTGHCKIYIIDSCQAFSLLNYSFNQSILLQFSLVH